jgi:NADPH:quinone reductase-like Zn-dependent oxidoreductase
MRAVRCTKLDGPKSLRVDDVAEPTPGPAEVLLEAR